MEGVESILVQPATALQGPLHLNPRPTSLRASLGQLAEEFVEGVLRALRGASFTEMGDLRSTTVDPPPAVPASRPTEPPIRVLAKLSQREREIFERLLHGASNDQVARELGISIKTVQTHRAKVNRKLGVRSGSELVRFGAAHGLLNAGRGDGVASPGRDDSGAAAPVFDLAEVERRTIAAALRATAGDRNRAAVLLGIPRSKLDTRVGPSELALGRRLSKEVATPAPITPVPDGAGRRTAGARLSRGAKRSLPARSSRVGVPELGPLTDSRHGEEPDGLDADPRVAITDPHGLLGSLEEPRNLDDALAEAPVALTAATEPRRAARAGEDILRGAGGGLVLRRRRSTTPADHS